MKNKIMKIFTYIVGLLLVSFGIISCQDDFSVDLSNRKFVRISKQSVSLSAGEKMILKAVTDSLGSASKTFIWKVTDTDVASIESRDNSSAVITGLKEGKSVVMVESDDGELKYFADLSVSGTNKVVKILAIGNAVSEDAVENYFYDLAQSAGYKVVICNMFLEESDLKLHRGNAYADVPAYQQRTIRADGNRETFNDKTLKEVIAGENWDFITFQELSDLAGKPEGYQEFLPDLIEFARYWGTNPELKIALHQPWAYAEDATQDGFIAYDRDQTKMYNAIADAVENSKAQTDIDFIIPSGTAIQNGRTTYLGDNEYLGDLFTRDGLLLSYERGRFTAACTWFETIFGTSVTENPYIVSALSEYENTLIKSAAHAAVSEPGQITTLTAFRYPEGFEINTYVLEEPVYIDFGPINSGDPFNNFGRPTDPKLTDLKDQNGESTQFCIEVKDRFTGTLERGLENDLGLPKTASEDMFFSDGIFAEYNPSSFALSNFNPAQKYTFVFYGAINDNGTETEFRVIAKNEGVAYLVNDHNRDRVAVIADISPTNYGTLIIRMQPGPNNTQGFRFFGINAMLILPEGYTNPLP